MPLINCEINLILTWSEDYVISSVTGATKFKADTKLYVPVVTFSTQDNAKLAFKRTINWNKCQARYQQKDKINI